MTAHSIKQNEITTASINTSKYSETIAIYNLW